jgi:ribosomal protein L7Ae-like RNA K-turn-binding protein
MVAESIIKGGARLVLLAPDLSCKSAKEIFRLTDRHKIDVIKMPATMDDMMRLIGKRAGILAITDEGLSELLKKLSGACQE